MNPLEQIILAGNVLARAHADAKLASSMGLPPTMRQKFVASRSETRKTDAAKQWANERPKGMQIKPEVDVEEPPIPHELTPPVRLKPVAQALRGSGQ